MRETAYYDGQNGSLFYFDTNSQFRIPNSIFRIPNFEKKKLNIYEFISLQRLIINNSYLAKGKRGGLLVDSWTPEQEVVGSKSTNQHGLKVS